MMNNKEILAHINEIIQRQPTRCTVNFQGVRRVAWIMKVNYYTTIVKIMIGAKTSAIIKRHNKKHNLRVIECFGG